MLKTLSSLGFLVLSTVWVFCYFVYFGDKVYMNRSVHIARKRPGAREPSLCFAARR